MTTQAKTIDQIIAELTAPFPPPAIEWKPQTFSRDETKALAVPFLDARDIADRLDAVVGAFGWQRLHQDAAVGIGIKHPETGEWIWKYDVGYVGGEDSPKEDAKIKGIKGTASDSFKRAGFLWGIGRYLYKFPKQWLAWDKEKRQFAQLPQIPAWALPAATNSQPTQGGNGNGNGKAKMSDPQRAKLIELYRDIHAVSESEALKGLDKLFVAQCQHGGKEATYEDATKLTGQLLAEQKQKTDAKKKK